MAIVVTTVTRHTASLESKARSISEQLGIPYYPRNKVSLDKLKILTNSQEFLIVGKDRIIWHTEQGEYYFHPSMAKLRVQALQRGDKDLMLEAMSIKPGESVLDCTLGMGSDALIAAYGCGLSGRVMGIEFNPILAFVVSDGLKHLQDENRELVAAASRIQVFSGHHFNVMQTFPDKSVDIVYFDPMFRQKVNSGGKYMAINFLRDKAQDSAVSLEIIAEAKRIARKRVVLKERRNSPEFFRLGFPRIEGGKYSNIAYGIIEV